jgi:hypothetical protein
MALAVEATVLLALLGRPHFYAGSLGRVRLVRAFNLAVFDQTGLS